MSFPVSPSNGQQVKVNNVTYQYDSTKHAWFRIVTTGNTVTVGNLVSTGNVSAQSYYWANGTPFSSGGTSTYGDSNVAAYLTATYPITNDGTLRIGTSTGPDVYVDALNDVFLGHGGTNYSTINVQGRSAFSSNASFTANATFSAGANITINNGSNITVRSGGAIRLETGAYIYGDGSNLTNMYGNTQVAAYLNGNIVVGNISATGYYFANGTPFVSGGGSSYGNTDVAGYLPTYTGNISANTVTAYKLTTTTGLFWANGTAYSTGGGGGGGGITEARAWLSSMLFGG